MARALIDGDITTDTYSDTMIADATAAALLSITKVSEDPALTAMFPRHLPNRVTITLASGETISSEVISGPGSLENPMTDKDFGQKFARMAKPHLTESARDRILAFTARLEHQRDYGELFENMARRL